MKTARRKSGKRGRVPAARQRAGSRLVTALTQVRDALAAGGPLGRRFTVRRIEVPEPGMYTAAAVRATRDRLNVSQAVFAMLVGVSTVLVQKWEQGGHEPQPWARRLLDEINREPERWRAMVRAEPTGAREAVAG